MPTMKTSERWKSERNPGKNGPKPFEKAKAPHYFGREVNQEIHRGTVVEEFKQVNLVMEGKASPELENAVDNYFTGSYMAGFGKRIRLGIRSVLGTVEYRHVRRRVVRLSLVRMRSKLTKPCDYPICADGVESEIKYRPPSIIGRVYKICALLGPLLLASKCSPKSQTLVEK